VLEVTIVKPDAQVLPDYDVCILGAGIAGIIAALELAKQRPDYRICLVESGAKERNQIYQKYCQGENRSPVLSEAEDPGISRVRALGGTSHIWGGYISPLDTESFERQAWRPKSGWPISKEDLDPFYFIASSYFQVDPYFDTAHWLDQSHYSASFRGHGLTQKIWQFHGLNFASIYGNALELSAQIDVFVETTCVGLRLDSNGRIVQANCAHNGALVSVAAGIFVVSMGGLENARFLLNQKAENPDLLPVTHVNVGRYFSVHPVYFWGKVLLTGALAESKLYARNSMKPVSGSGLSAFLKVSDEIRRTRNWLDCVFEIVLPMPPQESRALDPEIIGHLTSRNHVLMQFLLLINEMETRFDNHVGLTDSLDDFGQRRLYIDLSVTPNEIRSSYEQLLFFGRQLGSNDLGRIWLDQDAIRKTMSGELKFWGGHHHMCTTRMSHTPDDGVVNGDCRFHDHENLFALGSSVFTTTGCANPTFTIGALAIRLAHHLAANERFAPASLAPV